MGCWDTAAIVGSAVVGGISSKNAASAQGRAAAQAGAVSERQYDQTRADLAPWRALGGQATRELGALYNLPYEQAQAPGGTQVAQETSGRFGNGMARFGRNGDTEIAHVTPGETVVPQEVANRLPGGRNALAKAFQSSGVNPNQYVVGKSQNSFNPMTGMREYGYGSSTPGGTNEGFGGSDRGFDHDSGGRDRSPPEFSPAGLGKSVAMGGPMGVVGYGVKKAAQHLATPNPDGTYGYSRPGGFQPGQGDGGGGRFGGGGNGIITNPWEDIQSIATLPDGSPIPDDYYTRENAMARFYESPDYNINFDEGQKALEQSAAARGGLFSGNTGTALARYGQDYGNRLYTQYANRLASMAGLGQTAATSTGQFGANAAAQQGNAMMAGGQAKARGWEGINNAIQGGMQNYYTNQYLNG